jgi:hypothetical protein
MMITYNYQSIFIVQAASVSIAAYTFVGKPRCFSIL